VSREIVAAAILSSDQLPLLVLHRHVPERTLPELLIASARVNDPVRLALFHLQSCADCSEIMGCDRGSRLIAACRGWRDRG
jgi:hypothetical protein